MDARHQQAVANDGDGEAGEEARQRANVAIDPLQERARRVSVVEGAVQGEQAPRQVFPQCVRDAPAQPLRDPRFGDGRPLPDHRQDHGQAGQGQQRIERGVAHGGVKKAAGHERGRELHRERGGEKRSQQEDLPAVRGEIVNEQTPVQALRQHPI
ncbi:MAG: hypothetical protein R2853_09300 [Thermomicrobiales bacterium]